MGLVPEFLTLIGICIFLAMSLITALLEKHLPSLLQYLFQGAAVVGLGLLLASESLVDAGVLGRNPTDVTRFGISIAYLTSAISSVIGLNIYLAIIRRLQVLAMIFSGILTVPMAMISGLFMSDFLVSMVGGGISPSMVVVLAFSSFVIGISSFLFLREASRHFRRVPSPRGLSPGGSISAPPDEPGMGLRSSLSSMLVHDWEESSRKEESQE
jgi:hypothetical protein